MEKKTLHIPLLNDSLTVEQDWDFILFADKANEKMAEHYGYRLEYLIKQKAIWVSNNNVTDRKPFLPLTLPVGTVLKTDRIEARKASKTKPCITFYAIFPKVKRKGKFWVLFSEANSLVYSNVTGYFE